MPDLSADRPTVDDWLLTEAVRLAEEAGGRRDDDAAALSVARAVGPALSARLVARARALPGSQAALADIARLHRLRARLSALLLALGLVAGALAARAAMVQREVDLLLACLALIGLPGLMLLLWALLMLARPGSGRGGLGGRLLVAAAERLGPRMLDSTLAPQISRAGLNLLASSLGRWYLSSLSHLFWLAFGLGALLLLLVLFSFVQYELRWGTTLLDDGTVVSMIRAASILPALLGVIPAPDPDWIAAGRAGASLPSARAEWARLLLALIACYTVLPRLLALLACALAGRLAAGRLQLDTSAAGYQRLRPLLQPAPPARVLGRPPQPTASRPARHSRNPSGPIVLVGLELGRPESEWPGLDLDAPVTCLGAVDTREQRQAARDALAGLKPGPALLLILCSLRRTPDAGAEGLIQRLADAADSALLLVLCDEPNPDQADANARRADWAQLARRCGGSAVELSQLTQASLQSLAGTAGGRP